MNALSDLELWQRARAGDADAFGAIFERHAEEVYNYCFRRTADWSQAEDLTSAVFLEAWRRRDAELSLESARPWLFGIATNLLRNQRRSLRRYRRALERVPPPEQTRDFADELAGRVDDERQMASMVGLLKQLPRDEQDIVGLCLFAELTYEEAAAALRIPVGTVRSRLSRARQRLRKAHEQSVHPRAPAAVKELCWPGEEGL